MNAVRARLKTLSFVLGLALALALVAVILPAQDTRAQDAVSVSVSIHDFTFDPGTITIAAGTTVTWTNNDSAPHTVTADDGSFDSGNLSTGQSFSMTFDTSGTYTYHCAIHPNMTATVVVTDGSTEDGNGGVAAGNQDQTDSGSSTTDMSDMTLPDTGAGPNATALAPVAADAGIASLILAVAAAVLMMVGVGLRVRRANQ